MGLPAAVLTLTAASTVVSTLGAFAQARAQKNAAQFQAEVAKINAGLAERAAERELAAGRRREDLARRRAAQVAGSQRTALAAANVDLQSGTPLDILLETAGLAAEDVSQIRSQTEERAFAQRLGAFSATAQSRLLSAQAAGISPAFEAGTTLLAGASRFAGQYYRFFGEE